MPGNQAMAEAAIYAGARFDADYPITPSSEIAGECSKVMLQVAGEVQRVLGGGADIRRGNSHNGQIITPQANLKAIR
jgi:pyruvate/2-oxoacid:ferredoxin oxidoreductase alpha subunit